MGPWSLTFYSTFANVFLFLSRFYVFSVFLNFNFNVFDMYYSLLPVTHPPYWPSITHFPGHCVRHRSVSDRDGSSIKCAPIDKAGFLTWRQRRRPRRADGGQPLLHTSETQPPSMVYDAGPSLLACEGNFIITWVQSVISKTSQKFAKNAIRFAQTPHKAIQTFAGANTHGTLYSATDRLGALFLSFNSSWTPITYFSICIH